MNSVMSKYVISIIQSSTDNSINLTVLITFSRIVCILIYKQSIMILKCLILVCICPFIESTPIKSDEGNKDAVINFLNQITPKMTIAPTNASRMVVPDDVPDWIMPNEILDEYVWTFQCFVCDINYGAQDCNYRSPEGQCKDLKKMNAK